MKVTGKSLNNSGMQTFRFIEGDTVDVTFNADADASARRETMNLLRLEIQDQLFMVDEVEELIVFLQQVKRALAEDSRVIELPVT